MKSTTGVTTRIVVFCHVLMIVNSFTLRTSPTYTRTPSKAFHGRQYQQSTNLNLYPQQQHQQHELNDGRSSDYDHPLIRRQSNRVFNSLSPTRLQMAKKGDESSSSSSLPDPSTMKASDLRKELESYGISTKSFFEKSEFVQAVEQARKEGKTAKKTTSSANNTSSSKTSSSTSGDTGSTKASRAERIAQEIENCKPMKVSELKKELSSYGISTKSFFEKSEFVRACAEARVDGVSKSSGGGAGGPSVVEEEYDPSYRDVVMQKMGQLAMGSMRGVIDVRLA